ncbi:unnamed protein product [Blepharisma stoltei]|uniref:Uncharacterized protein n=1 Tax=Blepharisma stoltei TaxID=1481888 RepID=A0AAU9JZ62_9CILI|nr:unnamed protein product [Blepharisma stoltei]
MEIRMLNPSQKPKNFKTYQFPTLRNPAGSSHFSPVYLISPKHASKQIPTEKTDREKVLKRTSSDFYLRTSEWKSPVLKNSINTRKKEKTLKPQKSATNWIKELDKLAMHNRMLSDNYLKNNSNTRPTSRLVISKSSTNVKDNQRKLTASVPQPLLESKMHNKYSIEAINISPISTPTRDQTNISGNSSFENDEAVVSLVKLLVSKCNSGKKEF